MDRRHRDCAHCPAAVWDIYRTLMVDCLTGRDCDEAEKIALDLSAVGFVDDIETKEDK